MFQTTSAFLIFFCAVFILFVIFFFFRVYSSRMFQTTSAFLILFGFCIDVTEAEVLPDEGVCVCVRVCNVECVLLLFRTLAKRTCSIVREHIYSGRFGVLYRRH